MEFASPRFSGNAVLKEILNDPDTGTKKLQKGSDTDAVQRVQQALFDLGWSMAINPPVHAAEDFVDGDYGPATTRAVLAYKTNYGLKFPPNDPNGFIDGFAGPRTLRTLDPQCVLLDEATAAIEVKAEELAAAGVDVQVSGPTRICDDGVGAVRPAVVAGAEGSCFYKRGVGAFEVHGLIFASYATDHGSAQGHLGYPVSDEQDDPGTPGGRMSRFEHGTLHWDSESGVREGDGEPPMGVEARVQELVAAGELSVAEGADLMAQHALYELNRVSIEASNPGRWVGFINGAMLVASGEGDLFAAAEEAAPDSMLYFEFVPSSEEV